MSKTMWGLTVAVVAAIVAVVFAASQGYLTGDTATQTADDSRTAVSQESAEARSKEADETGAPGSDDESAADTGGMTDEAEAALQAEAESYVEQLGEPTDEPMRMEGAQGFASPDQPVASREEDVDDKRGQAEPRGSDDEAGESASADAEDAMRTDIEASRASTVTAEAEPAEAELVAPAEAPDAEESGALEPGPPRIDLPLTEESPVTLADLIGPEETIPSDAVLYVHTVAPQDNQGIWGIVHEGILENFARGVAVHRGESTETYQVDIPDDADERRPDNSSSFLGRLIYDKTRRSYVYNYKTERIGRNPDLIFPGEEIVIVSFTPEELVAVYKHFVSKERAGES